MTVVAEALFSFFQVMAKHIAFYRFQDLDSAAIAAFQVASASVPKPLCEFESIDGSSLLHLGAERFKSTLL